MRHSSVLLAGAALAVAVAAAYAGSLHGPLVFDDFGAILRNPTLRSIWPIWRPLSPPPGGFTVTARPLLNLSLALNYARGGAAPFGYHLANLAIHLLATLTLFGLARRTLAPRLAGRALPVAFAAALFWSLHPLQTESVAYISQRAESLMGLFYLLTLYCFRRGCDGNSPAWLVTSVVCCLAGMATKEDMVSAPLIVFLYDATFVAHGFAAAGRRRLYYLGLAATWIPLAMEIAAGRSRGGTIGFGLGISWPRYVFAQGSALIHYLRLAVWPAPLVFDYGIAQPFHPAALAWIAAGLAAGLALAAVWAACRRLPLGFLGAGFFAILAPTSLVPGNRQTWAEHRMYLALAPLAILAAWAILRRRHAWNWAVTAVAAAALGAATIARNRDYRSEVALWAKTAGLRPENVFAQYNWGEALLRQGRYSEAEAALRRAIALKPGYAEAHNNLGNVLVRTGRIRAAEAEFETAARLKPGDAEIRNNLGDVLLVENQLDRSESEFRAASAADPTFAAPHIGLAELLARRGDLWDAADEYEAAARLDPADPSVHSRLGGVWLALGRSDEALREFAACVRLAPGDGKARFNYGNALAQAGRLGEALAQFDAAARLSPDDPLIHYNYGTALLLSGRAAAARAEYEEAVRLQPGFEKARERLRMMGAQ